MLWRVEYGFENLVITKEVLVEIWRIFRRIFDLSHLRHKIQRKNIVTWNIPFPNQYLILVDSVGCKQMSFLPGRARSRPQLLKIKDVSLQM